MDQPDAATEDLRRAGLYLGPAILGSVFATSCYHVACDGARISFAGVPRPTLLSAPFSIAAIFLVWRVRDPIGRVAFAVMAFREALLAYSFWTSIPVNGLAVGIPIVVFPALLTVWGSQDKARRRVVAAGLAFVVMFALSWCARYYGNVLAGRHSVVRSTSICLLQRELLQNQPLQPTGAARG